MDYIMSPTTTVHVKVCKESCLEKPTDNSQHVTIASPPKPWLDCPTQLDGKQQWSRTMIRVFFIPIEA